MTDVKKDSPYRAMLLRRGIESAEKYLLSDPEVTLTTEGFLGYKLSGSPLLMQNKISTRKEVNKTLSTLKHI